MLSAPLIPLPTATCDYNSRDARGNTITIHFLCQNYKQAGIIFIAIIYFVVDIKNFLPENCRKMKNPSLLALNWNLSYWYKTVVIQQMYPVIVLVFLTEEALELGRNLANLQQDWSDL